MKKLIAITTCVIFLLLVACGQKTVSWHEQYNLGTQHMSEGNYEKAVLSFTAAIGIDPNQASAYVKRGDSYVLFSETTESLTAAERDYRAAIELDETLAEAYLSLSDLYVRQGEVNRALEVLTQGINRAHNDKRIADRIVTLTPVPAIDDIRFMRIEDGDFEYAKIDGVDSSGDVRWTYTTAKSEMTELIQTEEIGLANGLYYLFESGTITALNPENGEIVWRNNDCGGASISFAFDENGNLFVSGYYGPDFFWLNARGETIKRVHTIDARYYWPDSVQYNNGCVEINMRGTRVDASEGNGHTIIVDLSQILDEDNSAWHQAYLAYIQNKDGSLFQDSLQEANFQLIYVDNDDVPELWIQGSSMAAGSQICTFDGQQVNSIFQPVEKVCRGADFFIYKR